MVKFYGFIGLLGIIFAEVTLFLRIQPFTSFFCPTVWLSYIILIDSLNYQMRHTSLLTRHPKKLIALFFTSVVFWVVFEVYNKVIPGWTYENIGQLEILAGGIAFATIVPAVMETGEILRNIHIFDKIKGVKFKLNKNILHLSIIIGAIFLILPFFFYSAWMWALVWTGFFLLLDPINYLNGEKSIIRDLTSRKLAVPLSLFVAGFICGFFWEFWNQWAVAKWHYTWYEDLPLLANVKLFEMPVLGYLAYGPFAWELYAMYNFVKFLFSRKEIIKV